MIRERIGVRSHRRSGTRQGGGGATSGGECLGRYGLRLSWVAAAIGLVVASCTLPDSPSDASRHGDTLTVSLSGGVTLELVWIPAGAGVVGSSPDQGWQLFEEGPRRSVQFDQGFWMGRYEMTQRQWEAVMGTNPSRFAGDADRPVERVSWRDCQEFAAKLNDLLETDGFSLPDEEEWEYACRAGAKTQYHFGDDEAKLGEYAWFVKNSGQQTHSVGRKLPNRWGLYDMYGNVAEWCENQLLWSDEGGAFDGMPPDFDLTQYRMTRGGSWFGSMRYDCRSASRSAEQLDKRSDRVGFRVVLRAKALPQRGEAPTTPYSETAPDADPHP